ncbi:MAG: AMIN domain-containing protein [Wolinella sp.]
MKHLSLFLFLFPALLCARDPFEPIIAPQESGEVSIPYQPNYFKSHSITLPSSARFIKKIIITYQNVDGSIGQHEKELEGDIDWHFPLLLSQEIQPLDSNVSILRPHPTPGVFRFEPFEEIIFEITGKNLLIRTPYLIRRDMALAPTPKILIDFQKVGKKSLQKSFETGLPYIKGVSISTHEDFYRVTLELDGKYRYTIKPEKEGFSVELR